MVVHHSNDTSIRVDTPTQRHAPLEGFPVPPPWIADAVCATTDPEAFFPEKGGSSREAKEICGTCTVAAECLDWALDNDERFGIWGGLSERERRRIKRPRRPVDNLASRVRDWANTRGIPVGASGRLPHDLVESYLEHHPHDSTIRQHDRETAS